MITLTLKQGKYLPKHPDNGLVTVTGYQVMKIKNSTRWSIGQLLSKKEVDDVIEVLKVEVIIQ